jgi:hypothetical protein
MIDFMGEKGDTCGKLTILTALIGSFFYKAT